MRAGSSGAPMRRSGQHAEAIAEFQALLAWHAERRPGRCSSSDWPRRRGAISTPRSDWLARACARDPDSAVARFYYGEVLYNRGLNEPALAALTEAIARNPEYAEAHYLLAFVYGDMGRHEEAPRGDQARHQAQPDARSRAGEPGARALERGDERSRATARRPRGPRSSRAGRSPTTTSASPSGRRATTRRRSREYRLALEAGEDRRPERCRRWRKCICSGASLPAALELYERLVARLSPTRPSCGTSAASACTRPDDAPRRSRPTSRPSPSTASTGSHGTISASRAHARRPATSRRSTRSGARSRAATRCSPRGSTSACCSPAAPVQAGARGIPAGAGGAEPGARSRWNGVGLVLMELRRFEDARNAFGRAVDADADVGRRPTTTSASCSASSATSTARCARPGGRSSSSRCTCRRSSR